MTEAERIAALESLLCDKAAVLSRLAAASDAYRAASEALIASLRAQVACQGDQIDLLKRAYHAREAEVVELRLVLLEAVLL